ncbi:pyridine nucleotide-disulfide oxidoreductase-domain-containing protein [Neohortaea acidophila]|uniref:Pyridine nucleotide-disulfide oxidoreductase-domain-containing protein n=1 Tax=Neohortaea acidophila TaxID=245834 RepID=A0A6A6PHM9_9PEZI|nr:pyridine nucleotide-disulfide oxidoreductase-domain-containing protein [Neohortaea acidophila]KAF2479425.1 pyridine nucleotide-disulfide oxidoreductase-domain-containing protein [Neohortaea acidophila]
MAAVIDADYLVIGAGAMGMAFVDTLVSDTNATVVLVDRYARPGGHWTIAYPYVRLHQPSAFYGVNSRHLGEDKIDQVGWNKGLAELATVDEVCAYYSIVMHQTLLPSGRVQYFAKHEYLGSGEFRSVLTGKVSRISENARIVDATYMKVKVPAMAPPAYQVAKGVNLVTPNDLPKTARPHGGYTVVGAGKTGIDACLWLLASGVDPGQITWIMPRDSWFFERGGLQPGPAFAESTAASVAAINESIMAATSPEDLFLRLEKAVQLTRMTEKVWPTMFKCATISLAELEQVKNIGTIIRQGRVVSIGEEEVIMEQGSYRPAPDTLYIDCSADALAKLEPVPVFRGRQITLQSVRSCQQVFSAAFIAHVEATYPDDETKNALCRAVPHPDETIDWLIVNYQTHRNGLAWASHPKTAAWLAQARLDWFGSLLPPAPSDPAQAAEFYAAVGAQVQALCTKLEHLIGQLPERDAVRAKAQLARF